MNAKKQTAANNATLQAVRKLMNDAIYRTFAAVYNSQGEGEAMKYLSQYFNVQGWTRVFKSIPQTQSRDAISCPSCGEIGKLIPSSGVCEACTEAAYSADCTCMGDFR